MSMAVPRHSFNQPSYGVTNQVMHPQSGHELVRTEVVQSPIDKIAEQFMLAATIADALMHATVIPDHLRGSRQQIDGKWQLVPFSPEQVRANLIMVASRALQWGVDPIALVGESFVVGGKLDFQGKVFTAVVNRLANLDRNLDFKFAGEGTSLVCTVIGQIKGESTPRTIDLEFKTAATYTNDKLNEQWTKDPKMKLSYSAVKKWARRHTPEVVLGLFSEDEDTPALPDGPVVDSPRLTDPQGLQAIYARLFRAIDYAFDQAELDSIRADFKAELADRIHADQANEFVTKWKSKAAAFVKAAKSAAETEEANSEQSVIQSESPALSEDQLNEIDVRTGQYKEMIDQADSADAIRDVVDQVYDDKLMPEASRQEVADHGKASLARFEPTKK